MNDVGEQAVQTEQLANTMLQQVYALLARHNIIPNAVQEQMLTSHVRAMAHRSVTGEPLPEVEAELFDEISPDSMQLAREVVAQFGNLPDEEAGCSPFTSKSRKTTFKEQHMEQITVVIGDRLGKGQKVAAGVEKAGGRAVVVPGMAADMKLGDVMKAENATFGISFCGSGGAGAITAQTKYGYKAKYGMRSVDEGVTAINEGCNVLGFGFMDKEELGERLVQAWQKKYGA